MQIDARKISHPEYRQYSMNGAIAQTLKYIKVGQTILIGDCINFRGELTGYYSKRASVGTVTKKMGIVVRTKAIANNIEVTRLV